MDLRAIFLTHEQLTYDGTKEARRFPYVSKAISPPEMKFKGLATSRRKDNPPEGCSQEFARRYLL